MNCSDNVRFCAKQTLSLCIKPHLLYCPGLLEQQISRMVFSVTAAGLCEGNCEEQQRKKHPQNALDDATELHLIGFLTENIKLNEIVCHFVFDLNTGYL